MSVTILKAYLLLFYFLSLTTVQGSVGAIASVTWEDQILCNGAVLMAVFSVDTVTVDAFVIFKIKFIYKLQ